MYVKHALCLVISVCIYTLHVEGTYLYEHMGALLDDLQSGYKKEILPVLNDTSVVTIGLSLEVFTITTIDHTQGTLRLQMTATCRWSDSRISWTPEVYGNVENVWISKDNVWTPALMIPTSITSSTLGDFGGKVQYDFTGAAIWKPESMVVNYCEFYMTYWPFDKQICVVVINVRDYPYTRVNLKPFDPAVATSYVSMMEWTLEETRVHDGNLEGITSFIAYVFKLKRKSSFYLLTTILPITLIAILQPFVFLLPNEAGDRVGFCVTIVLSLTVYFTIISEQIPRTADPIALICTYVMLLSVASIVQTVIVIMNLRLSHISNSKPVGKMLSKLHKLHNYLSESTKAARNVSILADQPTEASESLKRAEVSYLPPPDGQNNLEGDEVTNTIVKVITDEKPTDEYKPDITWKEVSFGLDKVLFTVSFVITVVPSVIFLLCLYMASEYIPDPFDDMH